MGHCLAQWLNSQSGKAVELCSRLISYNRWLLLISSDLLSQTHQTHQDSMPCQISSPLWSNVLLDVISFVWTAKKLEAHPTNSVNFIFHNSCLLQIRCPRAHTTKLLSQLFVSADLYYQRHVRRYENILSICWLINSFFLHLLTRLGFCGAFGPWKPGAHRARIKSGPHKIGPA